MANIPFSEPGFDLSPCGHTTKPGVYAVIVIRRGERIALYIGCANNVHKRVMQRTHPYRLLYDRLSDRYSVFCMDLATDCGAEIEKALIKKYRPLLNKQHKNGKN